MKNKAWTGLERKLSWKILLEVLMFLASMLMLLYPSILNGYPLLHSDSGSYIVIGFLDKIPVSRPIPYCWFVRHISLSYSLWLVVFAQALIMTSVILIFITSLFGKRLSMYYTFAIISILSITTGLPIYTSQIMPDYFLPVSLLGYFILLSRKDIILLLKIFLGIIVFYANIVHLSNLPIVTSTIVAFVILVYLAGRFSKIRFKVQHILLAAVFLVMSWLAIPSINATFGVGFTFSRVKNIVLFSRLLQSGAMQEYVFDRCEEDTSFFLCEYKDKLPDYDRLDKFIWEDTSFLYQHDCFEQGWENCWLSRDEEFGEVIRDFQKQPKYVKMYISDCFHATLVQLMKFQIIAYPPFGKTSHLNWPISHFERDYNEYLNASQQQGVQTYNSVNFIQNISIGLSFLIFILVLLIPGWRKDIPEKIYAFLAMIIMALLINAAFIATFAVTVGRFQGRLIWLLPFIALLMIISLIRNRFDFLKDVN